MTHQVSAYLSEISICGTKAAFHYKRAGQAEACRTCHGGVFAPRRGLLR